MTRDPHGEEFALYRSDRKAWAAYMAPRWREMSVNYTEQQKRELWNKACPELRDELRKLAKP